MILTAIILIAVFLRFWQLGKVPVSPDWDEAALGYNAYSLLRTGRDEYGTFLPRELRSYDDYKPPLYAYLTIPSVALFGLNVWAVRLPSAVMGSIAVLATYFLVLKLFETSKHEARISKQIQNSKRQNSTQSFISDLGFRISDLQKLALLSALLLAISPWHLQFSRIAFEANIGLTLNILGLVAFLYGLTSVWWMSLSAFIFGLALYAYHSERIFVPLLVLALAVLWRKELLSDVRKVSIGVVIGLLTVAPLLPVVTDTTAMTRLRGTSPLSDTTALLKRSVQKIEEDQKRGDRFGMLLDNRRFVYAKTLVDGYMSHFSLKWLFLTGDNDRHHAPNNGLLYLWELPFLLYGVAVLWRRGGRVPVFLFTWFFIAPIAASPTSGTPHAIRTLVFLPTFQIFTAVGILQSVSSLASFAKRSLWKRSGAWLVFAAGAVFALCTVIFYFHMYYHQMNREYSKQWQYGYAQAVEYAQAHKGAYKKIVVSTSLEQPHMFFLFYTKYDPAAYVSGGGTSSGGFQEYRNHFDVYEFRPIDTWENEIHDGSVLYIGSPREIPDGAIHSIFYLNGMEAIRIGE